jgi:hypothetical protein
LWLGPGVRRDDEGPCFLQIASQLMVSDKLIVTLPLQTARDIFQENFDVA